MTRRELEVTEMSDILHILDESKVLHLGLVDDGMPYIVPMNYGYPMEDGKLTLYLHGANKGYKLDVIRKNPVCCFEMECEVEPFEGKKPCQYGMAYYSLMGRGKVEFVEDVDAKRKALELLMKVQTNKDFTIRDEWTTIVSVMRIEVSEYTAKHRPATPV